MKKTLLVLFIVFVICSVAAKWTFSKHELPLDRFDVSGLKVVDEFNSPNGSKRLKMYFSGGVTFDVDYIYIGGQSYQISWVDNNHLIVNGKKINTNDKNDAYDYRK